METTKRNMPPAMPNMEQGKEEKSKVSKGAAIGTAVGVGVAAAAGGAVAGATVLDDAFGKKHYDLDDDDDEKNDNNGQKEDDDDRWFDRDRDNDDEKNVQPEDRDDPAGPRPSRSQRPNPDKPEPIDRDPNPDTNLNDVSDQIIENDEITEVTQEGEWTPVGWRTIADQDGNEVNGMLFEDGNGGYVLITEGQPGSGVYDVAMNPNTGETGYIGEQLAYTRGDLEAMVDTDGGYIAPGPEDGIFVTNDDINQDIIVTDDGTLTAQSDLPDSDIGDGTFSAGTSETVIEDNEIDEGLVVDDNEYAMVDEEVIVEDEELEQYLGDDEVAEVNEEPVEFVDDMQDDIQDDIVADNSYVPEETYDEAPDMDADVYDDPGMDMV